MAAGSFGWNNLRQMNMHEHDQYVGVARPNYRPYGHGGNLQIACRLCHQVFFSTQDLIDHIESHMKAPNDQLLLPPTPRNHLLNPPNPNPTYFFPPQAQNQLQRNPFYPNYNMNVAPPAGRPPPGKVHDGYAPPVWTTGQAPPAAAGTRWVQLQDLIPVTRPFLNQLEHALLPNNKPVASAVMESQYNRNSDLELLDLTLKL